MGTIQGSTRMALDLLFLITDRIWRRLDHHLLSLEVEEGAGRKPAYPHRCSSLLEDRGEDRLDRMGMWVGDPRWDLLVVDL